MSDSHGVERTSPSRRSVVKGAAWAVPAVVVARAAPALAASVPGLTFTGGACKLPGNADDIFKGYVFELSAANLPGNIQNTVTVISNVRINLQPVTGFQVAADNSGGCTCACAPPGQNTCNSFCTAEGNTNQRVLIYTNTQVNSRNTSMQLRYDVYDCATCTLVLGDDISSGIQSTPPVTGGGGSCEIPGAVPVPGGANPTCQ